MHAQLQQRLDSLRSVASLRANSLQMKRLSLRHLKDAAKEVRGKVQDLDKKIDCLKRSQVVLQKVISIKKESSILKIEQLVSYGLQTVFSDPSYEFKIEEKVRKNQVSFDFRVFSDSFNSQEGLNIMDSRGGGIVNIVSFLLRVVIYVLLDRKAERFMVFDEPFNNLSEAYHENLVTFLKTLSAKMNFQFVIVTHQRSTIEMADKVYEFKKVDLSTNSFELKSVD